MGNENMRRIEKLAKRIAMRNAMKNGYKEMAELNLTIAQEDFHLEEEGARLGYEMASKNTEGEVK